jgi:hypothetical protein
MTCGDGAVVGGYLQNIQESCIGVDFSVAGVVVFLGGLTTAGAREDVLDILRG